MSEKTDVSGFGNFRKATLAYAGALALIATLSMVTHVIVDAIVQRQEATARIVNISGRQRMLSQRISMLAVELSDERNNNARKRLAEEIRAAINLMADSHAALSQGSSDLRISPLKSEAIRAIYSQPPYDLNRRVGNYLDASKQFLALTPERQAGSPLLADILSAAHGPILQALDAAVKAYEQESEAAIRSLRHILLSLVGMMLATLAAEALFVFRPLFRRLESAQNKLLDAARTDPLTGCMNRRYLMEAAAREVARAKRNETPLSVMMVDIDYFKKINDTYGHGVGDEALLAMVKALLSVLRASDLLGRIGGEEFAVVLPDTNLDSALLVAEKLREAIAAATITANGHAFSMTASLGLADILDEEPDVLLALERADKALYRAKQSGRNRVVVFTPDLTDAASKGF